MVSLCLKSTNKLTLDKLEKIVDTTTIFNIYYSQKKFKIFHNLIIHYTGSHVDLFYNELSNLLCDFIIDNYEEKFIFSQLNYDFFYFSHDEKNGIFSSIKNILNTSTIHAEKKNLLRKNILDFIRYTHSFNIDGLINFRIYDYKNFLTNTLENEVHNYIVEKEYIEYINILRDYVQFQPSKIDTIHLIYTESEKLLLDSYKNLITTTDSKKYLSDISFSSNDFILNSIISLIPKKIIIHTSNPNDNFILFLKQVFENKYTICEKCDICKSYLKRTNNFFAKSWDFIIT